MASGFYSKSRKNEISERSTLRERQYGPGDIIASFSPVSDNITDHEASKSSVWTPQDNFSTYLDDQYEDPHYSNTILTKIFRTVTEQSKQLKMICANQEELQDECKELRQQILTLKSDSDNSAGSTPKRQRKRVVSRVLTDKINVLHDSFDAKLKPDEGSASVHNKKVKTALMDELKKDPENEYSSDVVSLAIKRKYESERRSWVEDKKGDDVRLCRMKKAKYEQRKLRLYQKRKSVITEKELEYFEMLSKDFMSEESDASEDNCLVIHKHPWCSQKVNCWMEELDKRYKKKLMQQGTSTPSLKRELGSPSKTFPPQNAPEWSINETWSLTEQDTSDNKSPVKVFSP